MPHARSIAEDTVEEERRLAYVGITRARRHLVLTHTRTRARHGRRSDTQASRFLFELRDESPPASWRAYGTDEIVPKKGGRRAGKKKASKRKATKKRAASKKTP